MLRLYTFFRSPHALKVRIALAELGLQYEPVEVNLLGGEQQSESYGSLNPHRKVPVLVDGGLTLRESDAILTWLGEAHGGALWPSSPAARAEALQWLFFEASSLAYAGRLWWADFITPRTGRSGPPAPPPMVDVVTADIARALGVLEGHLASRPYLLGQHFSLADCALGVMLNLLRDTRVDKPQSFPAVTAYRERFRERPSWQAAGGPALHAF
jgi:glutathione S-transferase